MYADYQSLGLETSSLRTALKKPLRPSWITPDNYPSKHVPLSTEYHNIICCTASHIVEGAERSEIGYIQGAGDDSESWSYGLTPELFWKRKNQLLGAAEGDIADTIQQLVQADRIPLSGHGNAVKIGSTNLYIGVLPGTTQADAYDAVIICSSIPPQCPILEPRGPGRKQILHFLCGNGKLGSRALRVQLPRLLPFVASLHYHAESPKILFACSTGRDISVGVALTVLSTFFDDDCKTHSNNSFQALSGQISAWLTCVAIDRYSYDLGDKIIDKALIRRRLAYISRAKPDASPSRSTLQSVHAFLMPRND